jgi:hypothetical protein
MVDPETLSCPQLRLMAKLRAKGATFYEIGLRTHQHMTTVRRRMIKAGIITKNERAD